MKSIFLQTFGCQMNEYDSELVRSIMIAAGYTFTELESEADIVMLNTCSVRENAHNKVYGNVHEIRHRNKDRKILIGILGCMATGLKSSLADNESLALDFVVGPDSYKKLPAIIKGVYEQHEQGYDVDLSEFETYSDVYPTRVQGVNAWVAVMRGCNNFCSFCIVPYTRGGERSRSVANVVDEVKKLADEGFKQVTLLGQNVNSYTHERDDFASLLDAVSAVKGIRRVRFTSPHPKDFPDRLIRVIAENPVVCKQVHLPLQAGNDRVLQLMNRSYTGDEFLSVVDKLRKSCPAVALSTDIIVGFPTETEADFDDTVRIMQDVAFDAAFMFKYSVRPNTRAARDFKDDVSEEAKTQRIVRINKMQADISFEKNKFQVGQIQEILIEQVDKAKDNVIYGRNDANRIVVLPSGSFGPGDFVRARIVRATPHQLKGEVVSS